MSTEQDRVSVLFIDSNDTDRNYYANRLKLCSSDYLIHEAATGKIGIEIYRATLIDCVILEVDLTDVSGFEVLVGLVRIVRKPKVPVVILTRLTHPHLAELALKNGAVSCLTKNRTPGDVLDMTILRAISAVTRDTKRASRYSKPPSEPMDG